MWIIGNWQNDDLWWLDSLMLKNRKKYSSWLFFLIPTLILFTLWRFDVARISLKLLSFGFLWNVKKPTSIICLREQVLWQYRIFLNSRYSIREPYSQFLMLHFYLAALLQLQFQAGNSYPIHLSSYSFFKQWQLLHWLINDRSINIEKYALFICH